MLFFFPAKIVLNLAGKNLSQSHLLCVYLKRKSLQIILFSNLFFFFSASVGMYTKALKLLIQFRNRFGQQSYTLGNCEKTCPFHFQECIL